MVGLSKLLLTLRDSEELIVSVEQIVRMLNHLKAHQSLVVLSRSC